MATVPKICSCSGLHSSLTSGPLHLCEHGSVQMIHGLLAYKQRVGDAMSVNTLDLLHCPCVLKAFIGSQHMASIVCLHMKLWRRLPLTHILTVKSSAEAATHPGSVQHYDNETIASKHSYCSYVDYFKKFLCLKIVCINFCGIVFSEFQQIKVCKAHVRWSCGSNYFI